MVGDPVGDLIVRLANAGAVRKETVSIPHSRLKQAIADKLVQKGYIKTATKRGKKVRKMLDIELRYGDGGAPHINGVKRISKPGRRLYAGAAEIFPVKYGKGSLVLSTPKGILTDDEARREKVGGERLFMIW